LALLPHTAPIACVIAALCLELQRS